MADNFKYDVFLSHSSKDKAVVRAIAERLRADKLRVWLDEWELKPGDNIPAKVEEGLEHSRVLVLCMSANAFGPDWATLESQTLRFRDPLYKERRFIPLRLDESPIKGSLAQFLYINWLLEDREEAYAKLLDSCRPPEQPTLAEAKVASEQVAEKAIQLDDNSDIITCAFSPNGKWALTGGMQGVVRLWDVETGHCLRVLEGHTGWIGRVDWNADQRHALSCGADHTVRLWDVETGHCLRVLEGHMSSIDCVAWSADGRHALSGSTDDTVRLWDVETGHCLRVLEGHTDGIWQVTWSADQRRALSSSDDKTVRLWDVETGHCLRVLEGHVSSVRIVAWSADQCRAFSGDTSGGIRVWDLSKFITEVRAPKATAQALPSVLEQVQYTNAKVLLVGDTGVGKSGLAERLVHKRFVPTISSHARKAHVLESEVVKEPSGVSLHQETVLWDLAGQPAYRLVHQLSMEDAVLACVLFDCRNETNPFEGAAYWSQVLDQARTNTKLKKILVAARIDVGGLPAGQERVEAFARENGFEQFIPTSAYTGEGCDKLLEAIHQGIPWNEVPKVTTTATLAAMRDYVARLKGEKSGTEVKDEQKIADIRLLTVAALHEGFVSYFGEKIPLDEFITHLERLEATDAVDLLVFHTTGAEPRPENMALLDPTRVDAYASALLVAAKDEPDGPGHLLESRVREGEFSINQEERIADSDSERHLLWYVMENLLTRDLALREQIKGKDYIVFPSQCTAELRFPGAAAFGMAFGFAGPVRSIYATLIAQLAHYEGFKKREFFQDAAAYRPEDGGRCLIRLRDHGHGTGELEVSFDKETPESVRQGFIEFVGKHLESKSNPGSVTKRHAYHCANSTCRNPFEDRVVKARLDAKKKDLLCPICEKKTPLVNLLAAPTAASESVAAKIANDARAGRQRMTAKWVIKSKEAEGKFDVFLSHNSKDKPAVRAVAEALKRKGIRPWFDEERLIPGKSWVKALQDVIPNIPCAVVFFGPAGVGPWEQEEIEGFLLEFVSRGASVTPVILPGAPTEPGLPPFLKTKTWVDMRNWQKPEDSSFYRLVCGIFGRAPGDSPMKRFGVRDVAEWQDMD